MSIAQDVRPGVAVVLDGLGPGPELDALVEELSPAAMTGDDLAAYLRACARQQARADARVFEAMHHLGRARAGDTERFDRCDEFSGDEVAATLCWSPSMAARKLGLADDLEVRLPAVGQALWEGRIDQPRAMRFCEWTRDLPEDLARHVCAVLLPEAPELPVGELMARIEKVAIELDPEWAARRAARAQKNGRLILSGNPSGTATLSLCDVSAPSGLAMRDRVDAVAAAVRGLGVLTPVGTLRKEVAERLLDGSLAGIDDHRIALILAAEYHAGPDDSGPDDGPDDSGPDDSDPDDSGPDDSGPDGSPHDGSPDDGSPDDGESLRERDEQGVLDLPGLPDRHEQLDQPTPPAEPEPFPLVLDGLEPGPGRVRSGVGEVRLRLTTALGLDDIPGSVPGYGTVLAGHARTLLRRHRDGEWRVACTDDQGCLQHVLLARRRPHPRAGPPGSAMPCRAIVELQVPTTLLAALTPAEHGIWAPLLAELQHRLADLAAEGAGGPPRETVADAERRLPRVEIARWVRTRDRHCVAPGCRRPAHRADIDHTRDHAQHGPTLSWNLGVLDRHHHRAKHHGGWRVHQPSPGRFAWCTRAGVHHTTTPKKILEPPVASRPAARPRPLPDDTPPWANADDDPNWRARYLYRTGLARAATTAASTPTPTRTAVHTDDDPPF